MQEKKRSHPTVDDCATTHSLCKRFRTSCVSRKRSASPSAVAPTPPSSPKRGRVDFRAVTAERCAAACALRGEQFEMASSILDHTTKRDHRRSRINALYRTRVAGMNVRLLAQQDQRIRALNGELLEAKAQLERLKCLLSMRAMPPTSSLERPTPTGMCC
jgi:hypothetical protein